jgi:hypothetical protein
MKYWLSSFMTQTFSSDIKKLAVKLNHIMPVALPVEYHIATDAP